MQSFGLRRSRRPEFAHPELLADEGLAPHTVAELWLLSAGDRTNRYIDVTDSFDRKLAALHAHLSQTSQIDDLEGMLRGWLGANAQAAGLPEGRLAEAFQVVGTA